VWGVVACVGVWTGLKRWVEYALRLRLRYYDYVGKPGKAQNLLLTPVHTVCLSFRNQVADAPAFGTVEFPEIMR
jgi:hypothetical protein